MRRKLSVPGVRYRIRREKSDDDETIEPLRRAIAFNNTIRNSKRLVEHWNEVIESAVEQMPEDQRPVDFQCETQHVDGQHNAFDRKNPNRMAKGQRRQQLPHPFKRTLPLRGN